MRSTPEKTESIVLRLTDYGDHDRILGLYTRKFGKISTFAASIKKSQKRFGSALDLFSLIIAEVSPPLSQAKTLWRLLKTEMINPNIGLRQDLLALANISYFADCVWNLIAEEDPHDDIFNFLLESIDRLSNSKVDFTALLSLEIELLQLCGYGPRFFECVECNRSIDDPKAFFSFMKGGVICSRCPQNDQGLWMTMQIFESTIRQHSESEKNFFEVRNILDHFVTYIVGRELKSQVFRREVYYASL